MTSLSEQSVHFCFNDDLSLWLAQIEFGVLVLKMTNNTGFYGSCCDVRLQRRARRHATINVVDFSDVARCQIIFDVSDVATCQNIRKVSEHT